MALTPEQIAALGAWLPRALGAESVAVEAFGRLGGGAIQENIALDLLVTGGPLEGQQALVLRTDARSTIAVSWSRAQEFRIIQAAAGAGVTVPEPLACCEDTSVLGRPFYLMRRMTGEARGIRLVRDTAIATGGEALVRRLGAELAKLHRLKPPQPGLDFMAVPHGSPGRARIAEYRRHLDELRAREPLLEWALAWLARHEPPQSGLSLIHGDFRTGNLMIDRGELVAVLDWEFAAFGDPLEDLGWMLGRFWRFGAVAREAGGLGSRNALYEGYEAEAGHPLPRADVPWWEVMGIVRWAIVALMQAARHHSGEETSLELALTAHVLPVLEQDIMTRVHEIEAGG